MNKFYSFMKRNHAVVVTYYVAEEISHLTRNIVGNFTDVAAAMEGTLLYVEGSYSQGSKFSDRKNYKFVSRKKDEFILQFKDPDSIPKTNGNEDFWSDTGYKISRATFSLCGIGK
jgi:hypothetical protein